MSNYTIKHTFLIFVNKTLFFETDFTSLHQFFSTHLVTQIKLIHTRRYKYIIVIMFQKMFSYLIINLS